MAREVSLRGVLTDVDCIARMLILISTFDSCFISITPLVKFPYRLVVLLLSTCSYIKDIFEPKLTYVQQFQNIIFIFSLRSFRVVNTTFSHPLKIKCRLKHLVNLLTYYKY